LSSKTLGGKFASNAEVKVWEMPRFEGGEAAFEPEATEYVFVPFFGGEQEVTMTLDEAKQAAERMVEEARAESERLLKEAAEIKAKAYEEGRTEGYEKGHREGTDRGHEEGRQKYETDVTPALAAFQKVDNLYDDLWAVNEAALVKLATRVAERVVLHELSTSFDSITAAFKACMDMLQEQHTAVFRMHPDDLATLNQVRDEVRQKATGLVKISFEPDENLNPGDLVMETESGRVDATLRRRIEAVVGAVDDALSDGFDLDW
jgi:flagellar assembly protein FliH